MMARGLAALTASHSRPKFAITLGEKFSITRSLVAISSKATDRPASVLSSILTPRLLLLLHKNTGPHSHHWSQVGGRPADNLMPSGRRTPSTLITSAPRAPRNWVATGPAQKAVKSVTRMSDNGSASASALRDKS